MPTMYWEEDARCRRYDPEIFFAPKATAERRAKAICGRCPVRGDCLSFALEYRVPVGVWGWMNGRERRRLLRAEVRGSDRRLTLPEMSATA